MPKLSHDLDEEVSVCIYIEGSSLVVTPENVSVSIARKERAHWFLCDEGTIDAITFADPAIPHGPFQGPHLVTKSKRHTLSQCVVNPAHASKHFKYSVFITTSNGKKLSVDPGVDVMS